MVKHTFSDSLTPERVPCWERVETWNMWRDYLEWSGCSFRGSSGSDSFLTKAHSSCSFAYWTLIFFFLWAKSRCVSAGDWPKSTNTFHLFTEISWFEGHIYIQTCFQWDTMLIKKIIIKKKPWNGNWIRHIAKKWGHVVMQASSPQWSRTT